VDEGIKTAYTTGNGYVTLRGKVHIEWEGGSGASSSSGNGRVKAKSKRGSRAATASSSSSSSSSEAPAAAGGGGGSGRALIVVTEVPYQVNKVSTGSNSLGRGQGREGGCKVGSAAAHA
jgi:DNA gyrase subunit A